MCVARVGDEVANALIEEHSGTVSKDAVVGFIYEIAERVFVLGTTSEIPDIEDLTMVKSKEVAISERICRTQKERHADRRACVFHSYASTGISLAGKTTQFSSSELRTSPQNWSASSYFFQVPITFPVSRSYTHQSVRDSVIYDNQIT